MNKLSRDAEERLLTAVGDVAQIVADGGNPNDAVVKIASDRQLPIGHVQLLINAFNTGRTNAHRKSAGDVWERASEFPLADTSEILERLYPTAKTEEATKAAAVDYKRSPAWTQRVRTQRALVESAPVSNEKKASANTGTGELALKKAAGDQHRNRKMGEDLRGVAAEAYDKLVEKQAELRNYFRQYQALPFPEVKKMAELKYGDEGRALMAQIGKYAPSFSKQAGVLVDRASGGPFTLIEQCISLAKSFREKQAAYNTWAEVQPEPRKVKPKNPSDHVLERGLGWTEPKQAAAEEPKGGEDLGVLRPFSSKEAGLPFGLGGGASPSPTPKPAPNKAPAEMLAWELSSPEHENDLRSIQVSSWLQDMMANDQVLGQHHPDSVAQAYNDLAKVAPRAMGNSMIAKMMMGRYLGTGGRVDLFDPQGGLAQLIEVENKLKQRDAYPSQIDPFSGPTMPDSKLFH